MKKVLVTGATGFIGKHFVKLLISQQLQIRILARNRDNVALLPNTIEVFSGDLTQSQRLMGVCKDIDTVFHLGGYAHAERENRGSSNRNHHSINYGGTKNILDDAVRENVKRFIFFSSVKAVADCEALIDESWEQPPQSSYGIAKRESEKLVIAVGKRVGMHVCVLRPALVYGPGWKGNLAAMLRAINKGLFIPLPDTHNRRSLISIDDICHAALLAANHPNANRKIYFVTDSVAYSTYQIYTLMCNALGKPLPIWHMPLIIFKLLAHIGNTIENITGRRMPFNSDTFYKLFGSAQYDSQLIQHDLGFKPRFNLASMLPDIIAAYKERGPKNGIN